MAQAHAIDGTTITHISQALWQQPVVDQSLDLIAVHSRWRRHTWTANVVPMSIWQTLIGKRGSIVSLTTTDPDDRNGDYVTYYGARVDAVTAPPNGHDSLNMRNVRIEFLVKV
jgi:hypothetical protein